MWNNLVKIVRCGMIMRGKMKRKARKYKGKWMKMGGAGVKKSVLEKEGEGKNLGATQYLYIYNVFLDDTRVLRG